MNATKEHRPEDDEILGIQPPKERFLDGRSFRMGLGLGLVIGLFSGWAVFRKPVESIAWIGSGVDSNPDSPVNRETFALIRPDATEWEINSLLGSGVVVAERGLEVDASGNFREWSSDGAIRSNSSGTRPDHDGQEVREIRKTVRWTNGPRMIQVDFLNGKVVAKGESNLF